MKLVPPFDAALSLSLSFPPPPPPPPPSSSSYSPSSSSTRMTMGRHLSKPFLTFLRWRASLVRLRFGFGRRTRESSGRLEFERCLCVSCLGVPPETVTLCSDGLLFCHSFEDGNEIWCGGEEGVGVGELLPYMTYEIYTDAL